MSPAQVCVRIKVTQPKLETVFKTLHAADNTEGLCYKKVILATDVDVDGMHIRNLMITYCNRLHSPA